MSKEPVSTTSKGWFIIIDLILLGTAGGLAWTAQGEITMLRAATIVLLGLVAFMAFLYPFTVDYFATLYHSRNHMKDAVQEQFMLLDRHFKEIVKQYQVVSDLTDRMEDVVAKAETWSKTLSKEQKSKDSEIVEKNESLLKALSLEVQEKLDGIRDSLKSEWEPGMSQVILLSQTLESLETAFHSRDVAMNDKMDSFRADLEALKSLLVNRVKEGLSVSGPDQSTGKSVGDDTDSLPVESSSELKVSSKTDHSEIDRSNQEFDDGISMEKTSLVIEDDREALPDNPPPVEVLEDIEATDSGLERDPSDRPAEILKTADVEGVKPVEEDNKSEPLEDKVTGESAKKAKKGPKRKTKSRRKKKGSADKGQHGLWADFADNSVQSSDVYKESERPMLGSGAAIRRESSESFTISLIAEVIIGIGNTPYVRGEGCGLSWSEGVPMQFVEIGKWEWKAEDVEDDVVCQVFKNDEIAAFGEDIEMKAGELVEYYPRFPE